MDHPPILLQRDQSHETSLDFDPAALPDAQKKMVSDRESAIIAGCHEFQAHVSVTEHRPPIFRQEAGYPHSARSLPVFSKQVITFETLPSKPAAAIEDS